MQALHPLHLLALFTAQRVKRMPIDLAFFKMLSSGTYALIDWETIEKLEGTCIDTNSYCFEIG
jgi:hypothetical protein